MGAAIRGGLTPRGSEVLAPLPGARGNCLKLRTIRLCSPFSSGRRGSGGMRRPRPRRRLADRGVDMAVVHVEAGLDAAVGGVGIGPGR